MKTNLEMLKDSMERAQLEDIQIIKNGAPNSEGFIVINGDKAYNVEVKENKIISCTCPHHHFRGQICKHMIKVSMEKEMDIQMLSKEKEAK